MRAQFIRGLAVSLSGAMIAGLAMAAEPATLTRPQWLKKIGGSAAQKAVLEETLERLAPADRVEFTRRVIKAVSRMPVTPEEKTAAFVRTAIGCIKGKLGDVKKSVIAEVFAEMPIPYLPIVTEELAKRFDADLNGLSDAAFETFATETIDIAAARNKKTDEPSVRDTFVVLAFLRSAKKADELKNKLIARFPDEHTRQVVSDLAPGVLASGKYGDVLNAAGVEQEPLPMDMPLLNLLGHTNLDRLLADLNTNRGLKETPGLEGAPAAAASKLYMPLSQVRAGGMGSLWETPAFSQTLDAGFGRIPRYFDWEGIWDIIERPSGYQNQGTSVFYPVGGLRRGGSHHHHHQQQGRSGSGRHN